MVTKDPCAHLYRCMPLLTTHQKWANSQNNLCRLCSPRCNTPAPYRKRPVIIMRVIISSFSLFPLFPSTSLITLVSEYHSPNAFTHLLTHSIVCLLNVPCPHSRVSAKHISTSTNWKTATVSPKKPKSQKMPTILGGFHPILTRRCFTLDNPRRFAVISCWQTALDANRCAAVLWCWIARNIICSTSTVPFFLLRSTSH